MPCCHFGIAHDPATNGCKASRRYHWQHKWLLYLTEVLAPRISDPLLFSLVATCNGFMLTCTGLSLKSDSSRFLRNVGVCHPSYFSCIYSIMLDYIVLFVKNPGISVQQNLVKETEHLSGNVLPPRLLVVEDTGGGGQDNVAELTRRKELDDPLLDVTELDVVTGADDTGLVDASVELDDNLAVAVIVDLLELANVS
jgi:hypothetical protein